MTNSLPIDPRAWLKLSDRDLGILMLTQFAVVEASKLGIQIESIDESFIETVRQRILTLETESADLASVQVALHAVVSGNPEKAGRFFRQHLHAEARRIALERDRHKEQARRRAARKKGGQVAGTERSAQARKRHSDIVRAAANLKRAGKPRRSWAAILAQRFQVTPKQVRVILRKRKANLS